jgi:hypothetical protein
MWPRVVEIMLGCWLAVSPFVFRHSGEKPSYWIADWTAAVLVIVISVASCWPTWRHIHFHLAICLVGVGLCAFAYLGEPYPTSPALQNHLVLGLLLIMLGMLPNEAGQAPHGWRELEAAEEA